MPAKVGPNQPCPCDSGLKYKRCCGLPDQAPPVGKQTYVVLGGLIAAALLVAVVASARMLLVDAEPQTAPLIVTSQPVTAATGGPPFPAPSGVAPPGKVWSPEHGHYHDAPFTTGPTQVPMPRPTESPAPGQVWSEEHQHWH